MRNSSIPTTTRDNRSRGIAALTVAAFYGRAYPFDHTHTEHPLTSPRDATPEVAATYGSVKTTRTFVLSYSDSIRNGWISRQLPRLFKGQRLEELSIDPVQVFVHYSLAELGFGSHLALLQTNGTLDAVGRSNGGSTCNM